MADLKTIASDPDFWKQTRPVQIEILNSIDADFSALPDRSKHEVIESFNPARPDMKPRPLRELPGIIAEEAPAFIGGVAGGMLAAPGIVSTPAGVAAGAAAGELVKETAKQALFPEARKSPLTTAVQAGKRGLMEGAFELGGGLLARGVGKLVSPFGKKVIPEAEQVMSAYSGRLKEPVLLPSEATTSRALDVVQNVAEHSLVGGGKISAFKEARQKEFDRIADEIIGQYGPKLTPEETGQAFVDIVSGKMKVFREAARIKYDEVDNLAGGAIVPTLKLKQFAKPLQQQATAVSGIKSAQSGDDLINAIMELPDQIKFSEAQELRSRLLDIASEFTVQNKNARVIGKAKRLSSITDQEMGNALRSNPAAYTAWKEANEFYRTGQDQFNNQFIRKMIRAAEENGTGPEVIGSMIFRPGAISNIRKVKAVVDPQDWKKFQSFYVQHLFKQSADQDNVIQGGRLLNNMIGKPGAMGEPVLKEIFSPEQLKEIRNFGQALKLAQAKQGEGTGSVWIQLTQAGAAGGLMFAPGDPNVLAGSGAILLTPPILAKLLTNPRTARLLSTGYRLPAKSPQRAGLATRLMREIYIINRERQMVEQAPQERGARTGRKPVLTR